MYIPLQSATFLTTQLILYIYLRSSCQTNIQTLGTKIVTPFMAPKVAQSLCLASLPHLSQHKASNSLTNFHRSHTESLCSRPHWRSAQLWWRFSNNNVQQTIEIDTTTQQIATCLLKALTNWHIYSLIYICTYYSIILHAGNHGGRCNKKFKFQIQTGIQKTCMEEFKKIIRD